MNLQDQLELDHLRRDREVLAAGICQFVADGQELRKEVDELKAQLDRVNYAFDACKSRLHLLENERGRSLESKMAKKYPSLLCEGHDQGREPDDMSLREVDDGSSPAGEENP